MLIVLFIWDITLTIDCLNCSQDFIVWNVILNRALAKSISRRAYIHMLLHRDAKYEQASFAKAFWLNRDGAACHLYDLLDYRQTQPNTFVIHMTGSFKFPKFWE